MGPFRFVLGVVTLAGLSTAAGFLWAPLVSPQVGRLDLAAPEIRSRVIDPPLRVAPVDVVAHHRVPTRVAGGAIIPRRDVVLTPAPPRRAVTPLQAAAT